MADEEKSTYTGILDFSIAIISMAVGLGNFWRFPFMAYENGGGAFLVPYMLALFSMGTPLYYVELTIAQFTGKANVDLFRNVGPAYIGVGYCQVYISFCIMTYYALVVSLSLLYLAHSFKPQMPWGECQPNWDNCISSTAKSENMSANMSMSSSAELYFVKTVLNEKTDIEDGLGGMQYQIVIALAATWLSCLIILIYGMESLKRMTYFLALFPYFMLIIVFIRAITLPGAKEGVEFFYYPDWSLLKSPKVWVNAIGQVFFSIGIGCGCTNLYASHIDFKSDMRKVSYIIAIVDTLSSLMCGMTIFATLGNLSYETKVPIKSVIKSGSSVAFISYPDALAKIQSVPWLMSIMFFVMLYVLGLGSLISYHAVISKNFKEYHDFKDWQLSMMSATLGFLFGLVYCTQGGQYVIDIVDNFGGGYLVYFVSLLQTIPFVWFYGIRNYSWDMEFMSGHKIYCMERWSLVFFSPITLFMLFIFNIITFKPLRRYDKEMPFSAQACGWLLFILCLLILPFFAIKAWIQKGFQKAFFDFSNWVPKTDKLRAEWTEYRAKRQRELDEKNLSKCKSFIDSMNGM